MAHFAQLVAVYLVEALAAYEVPVLKTTIAQRIAFAEAAASGSTVLETEPESLAAREITSLVREIMEVGA